MRQNARDVEKFRCPDRQTLARRNLSISIEHGQKGHPMFCATDIARGPTPGRTGRYYYRRVKLQGLRHDGLVRYDPRLELLVDDVRAYIASFLSSQAMRLGPNTFLGRMYTPVLVPLPSDPAESRAA